MNNRWSERQIIRLYVMVYYGPLGLIKGVARDISCNGMFVESGRIILSSDEIIQISFQYPFPKDENHIIDGTTRNNSFSIPAHVVHSSRKGAGLQFLNYIFKPAEHVMENKYLSLSR